ncbi:hypothetical protein Bhyg_00938, partial [Pseudolycoriella hygida]
MSKRTNYVCWLKPQKKYSTFISWMSLDRLEVIRRTHCTPAKPQLST